MIAAVRERDETARFLARSSDFDLDRGDHVERAHLASGAALESCAGDGAGGTYLFSGEGGEERPILYADSEVAAALVVIGPSGLLRLLLVALWWRGCQWFTAEGSRELADENPEDMPDLVPRRDPAAAALGVMCPGVGAFCSRRKSGDPGAPSG
ncbi:hypothetical protein [Streptomyces sp. NPDC058695]|uniref:hypothetical protein n=1 Tax=Streptomyces sp. NPDC058695 TaxID=3346604 RepID=UPI0036665688